MATRSEKERREIEEKCQAVLKQLLLDDDNKYCVDCDNKGPRWAAWNLGIFLCIRCAGIHRNLGVHISRVKSVTLDTWTPEQVACLQQMGNSRARAVYEANLPNNFRRPQTDSSLEPFIRAKYEQKKYIAKEWVPPPMPKPSIETEDTKKKSDRKSRTKTAAHDSNVPNPIPAPKVKSNTPTSSASSTPPPIITDKQETNVVKAAPKTSATVDLLGLDDHLAPSQSQNSDLFGNFLSAAPAQEEETAANSTTTLATSVNEEENMFKPPAAEDKKQQQMTKESILSLYGQSAPPPSQTQMFGIPGGMYMAPSPQQTFAPPAMQPNIPLYNIPRGMMPNGIMGSQPSGHQSQQALGSANIAGTNPFLNPAVAGMYATNQGQATPMGVVAQNDLMWNSGFGGRAMVANPLANPFLPQQMASMSLGSAPNLNVAANTTWSAQPSGQTLATNLWQ